MPSPDELRDRFDPEFYKNVGEEGLTGWVTQMATLLQVRGDPVEGPQGGLRLAFSPRGGPIIRWHLDVWVAEGGERIAGMNFQQIEIEGVDLSAGAVSGLSADERIELHRVFDATYADANHDYLDASLDLYRNVARARADGQLIGFALSDMRVIDLPGLPSQLVTFGGLGCVVPDTRRRGVFGQLEMMAATAGDVEITESRMTVGRFAHPAVYRRVRRQSDNVVPRSGLVPSSWHRKIGAEIAAWYRVSAFDPETFVCRGDGRPVGTPLIEVEAEPEDWAPFESVDRSRGDQLLALWWSVPPEGW